MDSRGLWRVAATYGAIGGTRAPDLLQYPPSGFRPIERRVRIGDGADRFAFAATETMSWGIQRRSGMRVLALEPPAAVTRNSYQPVAFDEAGEPVVAATVGEPEAVYTASGRRFIRAGDTALLRIGAWPLRAPVRVVYVIDEPTRKGFAYGTLPGHPESGEEAFVVEHRPDDSVWLTVRAFSRPANLAYALGAPLARALQGHYTRRYERALAGALPDPAPTEEPRPS